MFQTALRRTALPVALAVAVPAIATAYFCPERLSAEGAALVLLAEQLLVDEEDPSAGMVVGHYRSDSGQTIVIECTGGSRHYDMLGEFA